MIDAAEFTLIHPPFFKTSNFWILFYNRIAWLKISSEIKKTSLWFLMVFLKRLLEFLMPFIFFQYWRNDGSVINGRFGDDWLTKRWDFTHLLPKSGLKNLLCCCKMILSIWRFTSNCISHCASTIEFSLTICNNRHVLNTLLKSGILKYVLD